MNRWFRNGFVTGAVIGAALGMLTAPTGGRAARHRIKQAVRPSLVRLSELRVNMKGVTSAEPEVIKQAI